MFVYTRYGVHLCYPEVEWEAKVYTTLAGGVGIPRLYMHGSEG